MKKLILFGLILHGIITATDDEAVVKMNQTAYTFGKVQDYTRAIHLYSELLTQQLPPWKKSRVLYNLGTLQLAQNQPKKALETFSQIDPQTLSIPDYARDLFINEAFAYLKYAENQRLSGETLWETKKFFLKKSLQLFKKAQKVECNTRQMETHSSVCKPNDFIEKGIATVHQFLTSIQEEIASNWLKESGYKKEEDLFSAFEIASPMQQLCLKYRLFLLQDPPSLAGLEQLLKDIENLKPEDRQKNLIEIVKNNLKLSEQHLKKKELEQSLFYILMASELCENQETGKNADASIQLKKSLVQAEKVLKLTYQWLLMPDEVGRENKWLDLLKIEQQKAIGQGNLFIPAVIEEQKKEFKDQSCSTSKWYQVIPLFDLGYNAAEKTSKLLLEQVPPGQEMIEEEITTVKKWSEALSFLIKPPKETAEDDQSNRSSSQEMGENLRLLQEMYLQDQQKQAPINQEFHSW